MDSDQITNLHAFNALTCTEAQAIVLSEAVRRELVALDRRADVAQGARPTYTALLAVLRATRSAAGGILPLVEGALALERVNDAGGLQLRQLASARVTHTRVSLELAREVLEAIEARAVQE